MITRVKQNKTEHEISVHPQTVHHHNPYILLTSVTGFTLLKQAGKTLHCSRDYSVSCTSVLMSSLPTSITFNVLNSHSSHFSIFSWKHLFHKCQAIISSQHVLICLITTSSGRQLHLTVCHLRCSNRVSTYGSVHRFQKSFTTDWTR